MQNEARSRTQTVKSAGSSSTIGMDMDTLGFEPRAFRMRSGCDTTTPCALDAKLGMPMLRGFEMSVDAA